MNKTLAKQNKRERRHARIRAKVAGTAERPRLAVFKSNRFIYAQLIDDDKGVTLASVKTVAGTPGRAAATAAGNSMATAAKAKGVSKVVFDRGGFSYIGTIREFAEAARAGGLEF